MSCSLDAFRTALRAMYIILGLSSDTKMVWLSIKVRIITNFFGEASTTACNIESSFVTCFNEFKPAAWNSERERHSRLHDSIVLFRGRMRLIFFGRSSAWRCPQCPQIPIHSVQRRGYSTPGKPTNIFNKRRKAKTVQLAAAGGTLTATAIFFSDEVKHGYHAAERSARVIAALATCVNE